MQGRLRQEKLALTIETECGHCQRPMSLTLGSDLAVIDQTGPETPLVFMPQVDWETFTEPNIINAY